ncbi:hypothetical protein Pmani_019212 [Petrolisthes manimaculis]|uniref:alpha-1,2-Mannosidase n=1 Tax=Petrolisthes manimaculis TaxID=1843537 RepID=A0AAE1U5X9_9EUCA|nr:hypothetical protein Pmani_019212 [Petrolisthes manimaculis]
MTPSHPISVNYAWASGGSSILSEFGTLHLEFVYLSDISGDPVFREKVNRIRDVIRKAERPDGLYPNYMNPVTGKWGQHHTSIGALGDSFYEYLIKSYIQSGGKDEVARDMYLDAISTITNKLVMKSVSGLTYLAESKDNRLEHKMDHLACFSGGMYALGAKKLKSNITGNHMDIAEGIAHTCHESYARTPTGLGPERFLFTEGNEALGLKSSGNYYILRPEAIESWFYMWRFTKDQKYRDWAWDAVLALEKHCRAEAGYSGVQNVYMETPQKDDVQQSFILAETFKYLYLIFSDDSLLSLDEWVFNTEAHPLPVYGTNAFYRKPQDKEDLFSLSTGTVAPPAGTHVVGEVAYQQFKARLDDDQQQTLKMTFTNLSVKHMSKNSQDIVLTGDCKLFTHMMLVGERRIVNMKNVLAYPPPQAYCYGHLQIVMENKQGSPCQRTREECFRCRRYATTPSASIIDGMDLIQKLIGSNKTFGHVAELAFINILHEGEQNKRIYIVFDVYLSTSIKQVE